MTFPIGVDVSKLTLDSAYAMDVQQKKSRKSSTSNSRKGFSVLTKWALKVTGAPSLEKLTFVIEPTSVYHESLVHYLYDRGAKIHLVNPRKVRNYAIGIDIIRKNDPLDAEVLSRYGHQALKVKYWQPMSENALGLKSLMSRLRALNKDRQRESNRLEKVEKSHQAHRAEQQSVKKMIRYLEKEIAHMEQVVEELINGSDQLSKDVELLLSIPGIGVKTAWMILLVYYSKDFGSAKQMANYVGLDPVEKTSGTSLHKIPRLSKTGNGWYRQSLYFPAIVACRFNPDVKALYERLLSNGKTKMSAIGAAMRKLVHICYGVLKNQRSYQAQH